MTAFVRALKECWLPDPVEYHGDFFDVPKCNNSPEPIRRNAAGEPQIEVAMGGGGNANGDEGKGSASEPLHSPFEGAQIPGIVGRAIMLARADSRRGVVDVHHRRGDVDRPVVVGSWALQRKFTVFAAVLLATGALALLPEDHTNAADSITIRALLSDDGNVLIQRHYSSAGRWVTVGAIALGQPEDGAVFQHGSTTLAIEFIPEARLPLPKDGGITTRPVPSGEPAPPCEMEEVAWDDEGNPTRWEGECAGAPMAHLVTVSCEWGWGTSLGPYKELGSALDAGLHALLICNHGRLLQGLPSVPGPISLDELQASVAATLAAKGETRPLEAIPEEATQSNPIRSETTYVDIRVLKVAGSDGEPAISVQARGGGVQQPLRLGTPATVGIFSLAP